MCYGWDSIQVNVCLEYHFGVDLVWLVGALPPLEFSVFDHMMILFVSVVKFISPRIQIGSYLDSRGINFTIETNNIII